jgi:SAM-dependent methyltransferase
LGVEVSGKPILDLGCGMGGPDIALASELAATSVIGLEIEPGILEGARRFAAIAGLSARIHYALIVPGPLLFPDDSFDIVFSKEAIIQIPDKESVFQQVHRVLRPDGAFVESDRLGRHNSGAPPEWARFRELTHWTSEPVTAEEITSLLQAVGFACVSSRDRNTWYAVEKIVEIRRKKGPLREKLIAAVGQEAYDGWLTVNMANFAAVQSGARRPTHVRGFKA